MLSKLVIVTDSGNSITVSLYLNRAVLQKISNFNVLIPPLKCSPISLIIDIYLSRPIFQTLLMNCVDLCCMYIGVHVYVIMCLYIIIHIFFL